MTRYSYAIAAASTTPTAGTGTISVGAASKNVSGSSTSFTTELEAGDVFISEGQTLSVATVTNNTALVLAVAAGAAISGKAFTFVPLTNVESLTTPVYPPKSTFRPYFETVKLANGLERGLGRPIAAWQWGFLTRAMRDQLRTFCTSKSASIYIRTRTNESADAYATFSGVMLWPDDEDKQAGRRINFNLDFRNLVAL